MTEKAIITISLVPEAQKVEDKTIQKEIIEESQIPCCKKIEKVEIEKLENCVV